MSLNTIGTRKVVTVEPSTPATKVACMMKDRFLGSIVVVEDDKPVGIITDRDLVVRILCPGLDASSLHAGEIMSSPVTCMSESAEPLEAASKMREARVRRLPLVDAQGHLTGILTLDDMLFHLSRTHTEMAETIASFPVTHFGG
jgi:CBS domain-containing protein